MVWDACLLWLPKHSSALYHETEYKSYWLHALLIYVHVALSKHVLTVWGVVAARLTVPSCTFNSPCKKRGVYPNTMGSQTLLEFRADRVRHNSGILICI